MAIPAIIKEIPKLVAEIGFIGSDYGIERQTRSLFESLSQSKPKSPVPVIGLVNLALSQGKTKEAITIGEGFMTTNKASAQLTLYLGFAYLDDGQAAKGDSLVLEAVKSGDPSIPQLLQNSKYRGPAYEEAERLGLVS